MGVRALLFPLAVAIVWVLIAALAIVDFESFRETTQRPARPAVSVPSHPAARATRLMSWRLSIASGGEQGGCSRLSPAPFR